MVAELTSFTSTDDRALTLKTAIQNIIESNNCCYEQDNIPWIVWLLENPQSWVALPGKITLYNHDCLHILLAKGFDLAEEAFVIGFTMGNDPATNWLHLLIFKLFSRLFYPANYRFNANHLKLFDLGFNCGKKIAFKNLNRIDFKQLENKTIAELRAFCGIELEMLQPTNKLKK